MLKQRVLKELGIAYEDKLLIYDKGGFSDAYDYSLLLQDYGFQIYSYSGIEEFRLIYEQDIRYVKSKCAVIITSDVYIPYDIQKAFSQVELSFERLFPLLDAPTLSKYKTDLELISIAYDDIYTSLNSRHQTEVFFKEQVMTYKTIARYGSDKIVDLKLACEKAITYLDWINIAKQVARLNFYGARVNMAFDIAFVDDAFERFVLSDYGKISGEVNLEFPPILPKTPNIITKNGSEKVALIVMDGMSLFDFEALSRYMQDLKYEYNASFALIPTTTSVSRQSLLSGKYPQQLANPFTTSGEEAGFIEAGIVLGYSKNEIQYLRGYEPEVGLTTRYLCVVINEVDDIVHGQQHGRVGMLGSVNVLAESDKLQKLIRILCSQAFTVYITADHGNTPCVGIGKFRSGIEVQTKSKRMVALKSFAEETDVLRENTILYHGAYLDKSCRYYLCKRGVSFDNKGDEVMTHGGHSIDEVIVPFIKILEV